MGLFEPLSATQDELVAPRISPLQTPPIGFAHRGARAVERENTLAAFSRALEMGAAGLESDVWVTADGQAVLDHDGWVRSSRLRRRRPISDCRRDELPDHIPTLAEMYDACGAEFELSLDLKDPEAAPAVIAAVDGAAARTGHLLRNRLWLCHPDVATLVGLRDRWPDVRLCNSTRLSRMDGGPERRAAALAEAAIDSVNLHQTDWTGGLVTLFHRFEVLCFGWDAQQPRVLNELLDMGIDAVYSDHVDRMRDALACWYPEKQ
ncbi:MAG: glycerophosphodiester phosphodiesterase [bacterium]|nr:glycerophosphodiester phosphodiesterase [bacterium]